ncbi:hypothetical protein Taro_054092 [Colocasia esculenta]|uniref:Uncharacterized protein n=1 Tax=Colocasia esculenta TaxID=4460 RepID=A0A843XPJ5_COLES|nr:hypothetical protein [Colocasia esculenta]
MFPSKQMVLRGSFVPRFQVASSRRLARVVVKRGTRRRVSCSARINSSLCPVKFFVLCCAWVCGDLIRNQVVRLQPDQSRNTRPQPWALVASLSTSRLIWEMDLAAFSILAVFCISNNCRASVVENATSTTLERSLMPEMLRKAAYFFFPLNRSFCSCGCSPVHPFSSFFSSPATSAPTANPHGQP